MQAVYKLMEVYALWSPKIAQLRELQGQKMEQDLFKVDEYIKSQVWWNNGIGHIEVATGAAIGLTAIFSVVASDVVGKVMDGISKAMPHVGSTAKTYAQSYVIPLDGGRSLMVSVEIPKDRDTDKTLEGSLAEMVQTIQKIMTLEGQVSRNANQAG